MKPREFEQDFIRSIRLADIAPIMEYNPFCVRSIEDGLSIYHLNMRDGLCDVLGDTYSSVRKLVGDDFFKSMARSFVAANPPRSADMNRYGEGFCAHIETIPAAAFLPYLSDMARFDWAWNAAFFAADQKNLNSAAFADISPADYERLGFTLKESVHLIASDYPLDSLWHFCEADGRAPAPNTNEGNVFLIVWRPEMDVQTLRLTEAEYLTLLSLSMGAGLLESLEHGMRVDPLFDMTGFLTKIISLNIFTDVFFIQKG
jgi:hypothetical protein